MQNGSVIRSVAAVWVLLPVLAWAESGGVAIVNGTEDDSASSTLGAVLEEQGFEIVRTGSSKGGTIRKKSSVWCRKEQLEGSQCRFLANRLLPEDGRPRALPADAEDDYLVVIGEDLLDYLDSQGDVPRHTKKRKFKRSGFLVGFSLGGADARVASDGGSSEGGGGVLLTFDIGGAIRNRVALMYRVTVAVRSDSEKISESESVGTKTTLGSNTFAARLFLPLDAYVTAGLGLGQIAVEAVGVKSGDQGFGYLIDVGKEWPLLTHFVLGGELSHAGQFFDGGKSFITGAGLALRWYWPGRNR